MDFLSFMGGGGGGGKSASASSRTTISGDQIGVNWSALAPAIVIGLVTSLAAGLLVWALTRKNS